MPSPFGRCLSAVAELRELYHVPSAMVLTKKRPRLDERMRSFVEAASFCLLATTDVAGRLDVSPRGGPRGFVKVLDDHHVVLPDLSGNNLLDSILNVVSQPYVGMLFVVPGSDETVRLNGKACITVEPEILHMWDAELRTPKAAIGVTIDEVFQHCAKAFRRGDVWQPERWVDPATLPDLCQPFAEAMGFDTTTMRQLYEDNYTSSLAEEQAPQPRSG